jgi:hypothetical protein
MKFVVVTYGTEGDADTEAWLRAVVEVATDRAPAVPVPDGMLVKQQ